MKIRITDYSVFNSYTWYKDKVGEEFLIVDSSDDDIITVHNESLEAMKIRREDCIVIK